MANIIALKRNKTPSVKTDSVSEKEMKNLLSYLPTSIKDTHLLYVRSVYNNRYKTATQTWTDSISVYVNVARAVGTLDDIVDREDTISVPLGLLYDIYKASLVDIPIVLPHAGVDNILLHTTVVDFMDCVLLFNDDISEDMNEVREHVIEQLLFQKVIDTKQSLVVLTATLASAFSSEQHIFAEDSCNAREELSDTRKWFKEASASEIYEWATSNVEGVKDLFEDSDDFVLTLAILVEKQRQKILHDPNFRQLKQLLNRNAEPEDED